ncbi:MAG: helix-turn-helix transcriptional regulator [Gallionellaceae bacterium]|nr:helix-turn-helix transcriptional regulator [Gallionellaceae bacterium]
MSVQTIEKNGKPEYVVLPWDEYQAMLAALEDRADTAALAGFAERLARGEEETIPAVVLDRLLAGEQPVRVWREHRGLTQAQLAEAAGVTQSMVAMIERGGRRGTVDTLTVIARALKVDLDDLAAVNVE